MEIREQSGPVSGISHGRPLVGLQRVHRRCALGGGGGRSGGGERDQLLHTTGFVIC